MKNQAPLTGLFQGLIGLFLIVCLGAGWYWSSHSARAGSLNPPFGLLDCRDGSRSFGVDQFRAELKAHDEIYDSAFGGESVAYECAVFGKNIVIVGDATTSSARDTWPLLDKRVAVDPSASYLDLPIERACTLLVEHPDRTYGVLYQSDGETTSWPKLKQAASRLAKFKNLAFVAVTGVIPTSRLPLEEAMRPLGARFFECDPTDTNGATFLKVAGLVRETRRRS